MIDAFCAAICSGQGMPRPCKPFFMFITNPEQGVSTGLRFVHKADCTTFSLAAPEGKGRAERTN